EDPELQRPERADQVEGERGREGRGAQLSEQRVKRVARGPGGADGPAWHGQRERASFRTARRSLVPRLATVGIGSSARSIGKGWRRATLRTHRGTVSSPSRR